MRAHALEIVGGRAVLGRDATTGRFMIEAIRRGLPTRAVDHLIESGRLNASEIDAVVLPRKTLSHRRQIGTLTADQSDRLMRAARVIAAAEETFGSQEKAGIWLRRPTSALGGDSPLSLLDTSEGALQVEALLGAIDHGIAAQDVSIIWRVSRAPYADLSGNGARIYGGRWNSPGAPMVYAARDAALAVLEVRVHLDLPPELLPGDFVLTQIDCGTLASDRIDTLPANPRAIGDSWLASSATALMEVPSFIVPESSNVLFNPAHVDAMTVRIVSIRPFVFDERLWLGLQD